MRTILCILALLVSLPAMAGEPTPRRTVLARPIGHAVRRAQVSRAWYSTRTRHVHGYHIVRGILYTLGRGGGAGTNSQTDNTDWVNTQNMLNSIQDQINIQNMINTQNMVNQQQEAAIQAMIQGMNQ